jgi:hypothetical protein
MNENVDTSEYPHDFWVRLRALAHNRDTFTTGEFLRLLRDNGAEVTNATVNNWRQRGWIARTEEGRGAGGRGRTSIYEARMLLPFLVGKAYRGQFPQPEADRRLSEALSMFLRKAKGDYDVYLLLLPLHVLVLTLGGPEVEHMLLAEWALLEKGDRYAAALVCRAYTLRLLEQIRAALGPKANGAEFADHINVLLRTSAIGDSTHEGDAYDVERGRQFVAVDIFTSWLLEPSIARADAEAARRKLQAAREHVTEYAAG